MRSSLVVAALLSLPLVACNPAEEAPADASSAPAESGAATSGETAAVRGPVGAAAQAPLMDAEGGSAGAAAFHQGSTGVVIRIEATGLTPGWHGLHLHAVGQCDAPFQSAGSHIQHAQAVPHGYLNAEGPDSGDLPNLYVGVDGRGFAEVFTTAVSLNSGGPGAHLMDADGSSIVIHANPDDHTSQPIGGAGDRVACGVIAAG